jgi:hypothetical protein
MTASLAPCSRFLLFIGILVLCYIASIRAIFFFIVRLTSLIIAIIIDSNFLYTN